MTDWDKLRNFLTDLLGERVLLDVIDGDDITEIIYEYITIFCAFHISRISFAHNIDDNEWKKLFTSDDNTANLVWNVCWTLKSENTPSMTMYELYFLMCKLIAVPLPPSFPDSEIRNQLVIDLLCSEETFFRYINTKNRLQNTDIPENAIDRFFYKTKKSIKKAAQTIKESKTLHFYKPDVSKSKTEENSPPSFWTIFIIILIIWMLVSTFI
jgi:hypothetical protein